MEDLDLLRLMRHEAYPFPRKLSGEGTAWLHCKVGTAEHFRLNELPLPSDYGVVDEATGYVYRNWTGPLRGANNFNLRIAYAWPEGKNKPLMARIRIGGNPVLETVQVLCNHLDEMGVTWLWICNANGGKLNRNAFHSDALGGKGRACS